MAVSCASLPSSPAAQAGAFAAVDKAGSEAEEAMRAFSRRLVAGDELAYREFYRNYCGRIGRYLLVVARGDEEAAGEALQETMRRVVKHVRTFEQEAVFWSWLTVIARSALIDEKRKRRRYWGVLERFRRQPPSEEPPNASPNLDSDRELEAGLMRQVERLPGDDRQLVKLKYFGRLSVKDLAGALGLTEKAVESRLTRVRAKLKTAVLAELKNELSR